MNSLFSASSGRVFVFIHFLCACGSDRKKAGERMSMYDGKRFAGSVWSVRVSSSVKILPIKLIN
jgi:hypothetical protein